MVVVLRFGVRVSHLVISTLDASLGAPSRRCCPVQMRPDLSGLRALRHRLLRLAHRIEGVGERDVFQRVLFGILGELRIDIEHDRHVALLARLHGLLGEAKAVDLLEIDAGGRRRDIVAGLRRWWRAPASLVTMIVDGHHLAELDVDGPALRLEAPRQARRDIGVEAHRDGAVRICPQPAPTSRLAWCRRSRWCGRTRSRAAPRRRTRRPSARRKPPQAKAMTRSRGGVCAVSAFGPVTAAAPARPIL